MKIFNAVITGTVSGLTGILLFLSLYEKLRHLFFLFFFHCRNLVLFLYSDSIRFYENTEPTKNAHKSSHRIVLSLWLSESKLQEVVPHFA